MKSEPMVLISHHCFDAADHIHQNVDQYLNKQIRWSILDYEKNFMDVNDSAAPVLRGFGASISSAFVPYSHRWTACTSYILNTCLKNVIQNGGTKIRNVFQFFNYQSNCLLLQAHKLEKWGAGSYSSDTGSCDMIWFYLMLWWVVLPYRKVLLFNCCPQRMSAGSQTSVRYWVIYTKF